jgi:expansin (peptidoglycan-binding protein)
MRAAFVLAFAACTHRPSAPRVAEDAPPDGSPEIVDAAADVVDAAPDVLVEAAAAPRVFTGDATWYETDGRGACGFPPNPDAPNVVAINKDQWGQIPCGQCLLVTGPNGSVSVRVVDVCPGCARGDLDLGARAFAQVASPDLGRVRVRWHVVACQMTELRGT